MAMSRDRKLNLVVSLLFALPTPLTATNPYWHPCGADFLAQAVSCRARYSLFYSENVVDTLKLVIPHAREGEVVSARVYIDFTSYRPDDRKYEAEWRERLSKTTLVWGANRSQASDGVVVWRVPPGLGSWRNSLN